jgi:outer membrane protein TolC
VKISKLLPVLCAFAVGTNWPTVHAEDNSAQAAARIALAKQLFEVSAQPSTAANAVNTNVVMTPVNSQEAKAKADKAAAAAKAKQEAAQAAAKLEAKQEADRKLAAQKAEDARAAAVAASAQTTNSPPLTRTLSLRECIDLTLSRNLDLQIEHLKVEMAGDVLNSAYGVYVPTLTIGATHSYEDALGYFDTQKFNPDLPAEITTEKLGPELGGKVPFGFSYDFSGFVRKTAAATDFNSDPADAKLFPGGIRSTNDYSATAGVTMRQHLLKDFWIDADRELLLIRRTDLKVSQQTLRFQIMQTLLAVDLAYYDLIDAREEIRVQEQAVEFRRQFVADTQRLIELGKSPALDSAQAETQLQNTLTALAVARQVFSARQNSLLGLLTDDFKAWAASDVQPMDTLKALPVEVSRANSFQSALSTRPDLMEARLAVEKTGVMVKFRLNQLFPSLDLVGGYGGLGNQTDPSPALNGAFSFQNPEYSYGVVVSFPLSNVSERNNYRASKAAKKVAELQLQKAEQAVLINVADCIARVESGFSQVTSTHKAANYAGQALEGEKEKLLNGATTGFAVLQFQEILTAARTAEVRAEVEYNKALAQLAFADGTILERHQLTLEVK